MEEQMGTSTSPLFRDIRYEDYKRMMACFRAVHRSFREEEVVYDFSQSGEDGVGVVEKGRVLLIRVDEEGVETVLEEMGPGGVFGHHLAFASSMRDSLQVICRTPCEIVFIDYAHILRRCENACPFHSVLVRNMLELLSDKAQALSQRVDVLSRRSIREKLLCCFRQMSSRSGGTFELPFSLSVLADYIASDRSAMMRELKHMREDGVIRSDGRHITLIEKDENIA